MLNWLKRFAYVSQELFYFSMRMLARGLSRPWYFRETVEQLNLIGVGSIFLVALTGMFAGQGLALANANELADFGAKNYLGRIMVLSVVRELGPILTGLMVAARVASGITAEIGAMKSSNQLDAMTAFGIDPIRKVAVPRMIALFIALPCLTVICNFVALLGGFIIAKFLAHMSTTIYWANVVDRLNFGNIFMGILKPLTFSLIIAFIACYKGFTSEGGTKGVGRATTESVVLSSIWILAINFIITKLVYSYLRGYL